MKTIEISEETFEKMKKQFGAEFQVKEIDSLADLVGRKFYFRTVTYHQVGMVKKVSGRIIHLENASWVADSGRFMQAIKNGTLSEVEPVGDAYINFESVVDFFPWNHDLPTEQK